MSTALVSRCSVRTVSNPQPVDAIAMVYPLAVREIIRQRLQPKADQSIKGELGIIVCVPVCVLSEGTVKDIQFILRILRAAATTWYRRLPLLTTKIESELID